MSVRVRLAPSPTGEPHIGTMRTAIFDWLLARHEGGSLIVRVEDTDRARYSPQAVESLLSAMRWLGLDWDEGPEVGGPFGPYVQSQRLESYQSAAEQLVEQGQAYHCYCSAERLEEMRRAQQAAKQPPRYDRRCRELSSEDRRRHEMARDRSVVRFAVREQGETRVYDLIRGEITFANASQDDFVMLKSDGFPTYHLAVVVDDHVMQISHVLRGDEWLPSFPKHVMLYEAFGYPQPVFAHLPLILGSDRKKLSKRMGDTSVAAFRQEGYLPQALFNFLALLGWSLDDKTEIISREEFVEHFSLDRVSKSPAILDLDKLKWMNGEYIRMLPKEELARLMAERLELELPPEVKRPLSADYVGRMVPLVQTRLKLLSEVTALTDFFFTSGPPEYSLATLLGKRFAQEPALAADVLRDLLKAVTWVPEWTGHELERAIEPLTAQFGLKKGDLYGLIRVAISGKTIAPPLFESMEVLGRPRSIERLEAAQHHLGGGVGA
ncbi:MAG: glutamate--tRNA ligase [Dehalococcoidia bacterium]